MMHRLPSRTAVALVCAHWLLASCAATAQAVWPDPKPDTAPAAIRLAVRPNFQAPSATHCARPVTTREVPGWPAGDGRRAAARRDWSPRNAPHAPRTGCAPTRRRQHWRAPAGAGRGRRCRGTRCTARAPQDLVPRQIRCDRHGRRGRRQRDFHGYLAFRDRTSVRTGRARCASATCWK
jgi:hypothetical protein